MDTIVLVDHTRAYRPEPGVLDAIAEALTIQIERDFAPAWGSRVRRVKVGGRGDKIHFFDHAHQATDYGWHIVDNHGAPYAHVFAGVSITHNGSWTLGSDAISVTASHEVLEMLGDPAANEYCFNGQRTLWSREVCDAVQANSYSIVAGGKRVAVSNFVLPAFFNPWAPAPYDHLGILTAPFSIATGGYAVVESAAPTRERAARKLEVRFDQAVPEWQRAEKLGGWGRTYWRQVISASS